MITYKLDVSQDSKFNIGTIEINKTTVKHMLSHNAYLGDILHLVTNILRQFKSSTPVGCVTLRNSDLVEMYSV